MWLCIGAASVQSGFGAFVYDLTGSVSFQQAIAAADAPARSAGE
jgi:hypothetical protein